ncbi:spermine synthase [Copidosoma floridanum]|uniref:spermine synthase n=2 Tax=Copidosoma floridanum TaxID=29053 RepID=UPI0006C9C09D|nr:spermine synthase [Copidosoma floridanum]XP_014214975.1 spermine synthase [Copidosoma floridanum]XP_014214976.1 spermine synthase [Copidosoma floridanum]XP_014214977.1 spermine synthase [Copidosoma floridanum]XP_014214978.1 spermine synthase [Copidosoma floridanum]XP_014214979.1 spermine synthase [Copidosoma floridanum]XP_014214981.1 spermine synthase [Copidosoma floridanum]XP_014214982.1 spermine synthase [Copidosoma floridanum]
MTVQTILLDFRVSPTDVTDLGKKHFLKHNFVETLKGHFENFETIKEIDQEDGFFILCSGSQGNIITVRGYVDGTVTVNIEFYKKDDEDGFLNYKTAQSLEKVLRKATSSIRSYTLVPVKRGGPFERYFPTADERLLEYDIDKLVYEVQSAYQKVQIFHSKSLGNMLVLDDNQNMSEADLIYTETLMQRGKESYEGKEIVILGGGDGGLLHELLKENPKHVAMLELDEEVINGCRQHMKKVCGDCLDKRKDHNYEIVIGDCFETLKKMAAENRKVDYVFGDLTEIPISKEPHGNEWDFIRLILKSSIKILKPTGKFMTHGNSAALPEALKMYEEELTKLSVTFTKKSVFIPSFYEDWVFYQISVSS